MRPSQTPRQRGALLCASLAAAASACAETRAADIEPPPPTAPAAPAAPALPPPPPSTSALPACPEGMAEIEGFCIDRYEAHLIVRGKGGVPVRHPHNQRPDVGGLVYEARSEAGVFPQAYVSRVESQAACAHAGKRLCTRDEWQRACRGSKGTTYPYGDRLLPNRCNMDKPHLLTLRFGADPRRWRYQDFNDPALATEPNFLARSGDHPACVSEDGVHDLVGNVHEWVSDTADRAFIARLGTEGVSRAYQPWSPGNAVFVGGFFSTKEEHGPGCRFTTVAHEASYHDYSTGFRCCSDPPANHVSR